MRIALAQTKHPADGDAIAMVREYAALAAENSVDLLAFPECLMTPFGLDPDEFASLSQPSDGDFCSAVNAIAADQNIWILHTLNELNPEGKPFNTAVLVNGAGQQVAKYRKVHLFDSGPNRESLKMSAGDKLLAPIGTPFGRVAFAICYDLRFPEVARNAALCGAQLMVFPAAWVSGPGKEHAWKTLLAARAIENQMFVAGLSSCDKNRLGKSIVVNPSGEIIAEAGEDEQLLICDIDLREIDVARELMPVFEHRRPDTY